MSQTHSHAFVAIRKKYSKSIHTIFFCFLAPLHAPLRNSTDSNSKELSFSFKSSLSRNAWRILFGKIVFQSEDERRKMNKKNKSKIKIKLIYGWVNLCILECKHECRLETDSITTGSNEQNGKLFSSSSSSSSLAAVELLRSFILRSFSHPLYGIMYQYLLLNGFYDTHYLNMDCILCCNI